jgi:hypothetical protein
VGLGGATATLAQGVVAILRERLEPQYYGFLGDDLLAGLLAGAVLAAFFGVRRSAGIDNLWQRGVIAVLAAVGALLVGFLAAVAHGLGGGAGLVVWGGASLALGVLGSRWATQGSGEQRAVSGS